MKVKDDNNYLVWYIIGKETGELEYKDINLARIHFRALVFKSLVEGQSYVLITIRKQIDEHVNYILARYYLDLEGELK